MNLTVVECPYDSGARAERMGAGPSHLLESGLAESLQQGLVSFKDVIEGLG